MSRSNVQRVHLGPPYNKDMWWNTARRIINENHRGPFDYRFVRRQPLPDGASLNHPNTRQVIGTGTAGSVSLHEIRNYKRSK